MTAQDHQQQHRHDDGTRLRPAPVFAPLLAELARTGIKLRLVRGDQIEVSAPRGRLSADLRARIAEHRRDLVDWLARADGNGSGDEGLPAIVPDPGRAFEPFPLSDLQVSFLVGSREGMEYHVRPHQYMEVDFDDLDPVGFERALNQAARYQRANLVVVREDMTLQAVRDPAPIRVTVHDLRGRPEPAVRRHLDQLRAELSRRQLPLDRWPWVEAHVTRYDGGARLHYNNNNFFTDAVATGRFLDSVLHYYHHPEQPLPELECGYRDCVLALAELEASPRGEASKRYWCDRMADWPDPPGVPLLPGTANRGRSRLRRRELVLPADQWAALKRRAGARGLTLTNVLFAGHAEVLSHWSGSRHFLLNNMVTHRLPLHPQISQVLGNFASLYPLEVDWRPDEPFTDRVRRLQAQIMADMQHVYWSGVKVLQTLNQVRRTPGRTVLPFAVGSALFAGPKDRPVFSLLETPQVVLDTEYWELRDGGMWLVWDAIDAVFPEGLVDDMFTGYRRLLARLADDEEAWQRPWFDLLPDEQREQRDRLNLPGPPVPDGLLHADLPERAARLADKPAVVCGDGVVGYAELYRRCLVLAGRLREHGVRPGDLVALALPKGAEQIAAVFGALAAGGAYVPIDPDWPQERIRYLLADTAARAVLTTGALRDRLAGIAEVPVLAAEVPAGAPVPAPLPEWSRPDDLAYVIYTSGSTGTPKGAMLNHRGPLNTIADINRRFGIGESDVLFGVSSLCFDLSVYDVFGAVAAGATLVLPPPGRGDPASWIDLVDRHRVTVWNSVPAIMQLFVEAAACAGARFPALRTVLLSGDWIPVNLPERIREVAPNARVISLGGATEASIWSICFPIDRPDPGWASVPYGRPLANQAWYVLDEVGRDAPTWVAGQLYIGGAGLALGYLNDPVRTAAAFVTHPRTGQRLYRTGDLGRYLPSGDIEFLGRSDFQVKIQGFRVEPGEVEQTLLEHPSVGQAVVIARSAGQARQLAAFVVGSGGPGAPSGVDAGQLTAFLAGRLPSYLVPSHITVLDRLPLTANGKLDRRALAEIGPAERLARPEYTAPRTPTEAALVDIWKEILSTGSIGVHDNFFALGGQSFAALRVSGLTAQRLGRRIPLNVILEEPTVAALAQWLDAAPRQWSPLVRLAEPAAGRDGTDPAPWLLVHPAGGSVLCYRQLAGLLDRACYAFQAPGPATGHRPLDRVEELAARYLDALTGLRPHGPYLLGGWSSGGVIAFELAHQLERRGERVEAVVVVDSPAPTTPRPVDDTQALLWFLEDLDIGFDPGRVTAAQRAGLAATAPGGRLEAALALAAAQGVPEAERLDAEQLDAAWAVFLGVVRACNRYQPPRVAADLLILRAGDGRVSEFADHPAAGRPDWGWSELTTGRVRTATLPGTHHTLLTAAHVRAVAEAIGTGLAPAAAPAAGA